MVLGSQTIVPGSFDESRSNPWPKPADSNHVRTKQACCVHWRVPSRWCLGFRVTDLSVYAVDASLQTSQVVSPTRKELFVLRIPDV